MKLFSYLACCALILCSFTSCSASKPSLKFLKQVVGTTPAGFDENPLDDLATCLIQSTATEDSITPTVTALFAGKPSVRAAGFNYMRIKDPPRLTVLSTFEHDEVFYKSSETEWVIIITPVVEHDG